jgi:hypothetical protein
VELLLLRLKLPVPVMLPLRRATSKTPSVTSDWR